MSALNQDKKEKGKPLNILILEDREADAELILHELRITGFDTSWQRVETENDFRKQLNPSLDIIIADYNLPQFTGLQAIDILNETDLDIPVIVVTGTIEETALECLRRGAVDYLLKDRLGRLGPAVIKALEERRIREDKKFATEALRASEQRYRGIAETAVTGLTIVDTDDCITYTNPAFAEMLGYSAKELLGMSLSQIVEPEVFTVIRTQTGHRKQGKSAQYETIVKRKDGESRTIIVSATPLTSKDGKYEGAQAVITDITKRVQAENALKESGEKLRLMIDNSPIGFSATDLKGNYIDVNPALCLMTGYSQKDLLSKNFNQISHPADREKNEEEYRKLIEGKIEYFDLEKRYIHKNGKVIHVLIRSQLTRNYEGEPLFEFALVEDITERKLAEEKVQHLNLVLRTIRNVNQLIVEEKNRDALIQKACKIMTENRGYKNAWIVLLGENGEYLSSAESGLGISFNQLKKMLEKGELPNCGSKTLKNESVVIIEDPSKECVDCPLSAGYGGRSGFSIRLVYGDKTYGQLTVSSPGFIIGDKEEQGLFREIGGDIGFALHNIEAKKKSEKAEAQLKLQSLALESAANAIVITDAEGQIQWTNPAFSTLTGYSVDEALERNPRILKSGQHDEKFYKNIWNTITAGEVWHGEIINKRKDGELYTEEMTIAPLLSEEKEISNYIAIKQDITERVQAEKEIRQRTEDLTLINTINNAVNQGKDLPEILMLLNEEAKRVFNSKSTAVYLFTRDQKYLELQNITFPPKLVKRIEKLIGISIPDIRIPVEEGSFTKELLMIDGPRLINDSETIKKWMLEFTGTIQLSEKSRAAIRKLISQIYKLVDIQSLITVPMISAGELIGLMDFSRREPFTEEDTKRVAVVTGQVTAAITSLRAEKEKARSRRLLLTLSQAAPAVQRASTPAEIFRAIGEQVVKMGFDVTVFTLSDDKKQLTVSYHSLKANWARTIEKLTSLSVKDHSFPLKPEGYYHQIITNGETVFNHLDIEPIEEALPQPLRPLAKKMMDLFSKQRSIFVPLSIKGEVRGILSFSGTDLNESDIPAIKTFANQAAIALEKTRLFNEIQELATFNESIVQSMAEGIVLQDTEGFFTFANPAAVSMLGYTAEEWAGMHWKEIVPPDQHSPIQAADERRVRGESDNYELDLIGKDGQQISVLLSGSPRFDAEDHFEGTIGVFTDITERKRAEEEIQQHVRRLDALRIVDQAIMGSFELNVTLNVILEQLLVQLEIDASAVLSYQEDLQTLQFTQSRGFHTTALQYTDLRLGQGYAGEVALQRDHVFIPELNQDEGEIQESPQFSSEGFVSYYGVPLIAKGKLVGVLEIFHRSALDPDNEWVNYLQMLAGQAAIAIDNITLFNDLQRSNVDLTLAYDATIEGWAHALELKDIETEGHSRRVVELTMEMVMIMGISGERLAHIRRGALLHDIGKMGVPDSILQKPGKLTDKEWQIMRQHPVYAHDWLSPIQYLRPALEIPYAHHERWDGTGYPRGLEGEQIPLAARIFAIVDVWDALRSDRPYRKAWSKEKALSHIKEQSSKHFDPRVVDAFVEMIKMNK